MHSPHPKFLPPDPHGPPHFVRNLLLRPQNAIFLLAKIHLIFCFHFLSKKLRKSRILASQNPTKTFPKSFQNRGSKKHAIFHRFLCNFVNCCNRQHQKFIGPASVLLAFHTIRLFAFGIHFGSKKPTKNPSKTRSEPFKNRCQKRVVF